MHVRRSTDAGVKPKTYVRRKGNDANVYTFDAGSNIALDVAQLMDLAGLDLDKTWDAQPNGYKPADSEKGYGSSANAYPTLRLTGARIMIDIKYYNYELDDPTTTEMGTDEVYAVVEVGVGGELEWSVALGVTGNIADDIDLTEFPVDLFEEIADLIGLRHVAGDGQSPVAKAA